MAGNRGTLVLVVGPSGAGKDSVMTEAAKRLDGRVQFARRMVTRPSGPGEEHIAVSTAEFDRLAAEDRFCLSWTAHGQGYGISRDYADLLAAGYPVVVNVSRTVIAAARQRLAPVLVVVIDAPPELRARRLAGRGRESAGDIARRLRRADEIPVSGDDVRTIVNAGDLADSVDDFVNILTSMLATEQFLQPILNKYFTEVT
ncbi:MAG TPA: phosphonate metabolism protein/1,5-bisphosphokinase (PRPP-forming) PhnN [Rhodospirillaceae bacterium]|nr:phosphonate metabolism protein/1,5-bisphosphokinase (PRPP-forming) PhnN [Rhodospirillaceae bacterium]